MRRYQLRRHPLHPAARQRETSLEAMVNAPDPSHHAELPKQNLCNEHGVCLAISELRPLLSLVARRNLRQRLQHRFDASDVVQLTCIEASQSFSSFRGKSRQELLAWLETILRRQLSRLDRFHCSERRRVTAEANAWDTESHLSIVWNRIAEEAPGPLSQVIAGEWAMILAAAIEQIPTEQRQVVELRFLDGLKIREIAESLETTTGRVAGLLRRGVEALHAQLPATLRKELSGPSS